MVNPFSNETQFFYSLHFEDVLRAVEQLGCRATGRVMPLNSLENRVFQVEIEVDENKISSDYDRYRIAKFYRPGRWTEAQILEEHTLLQSLEAQEISVAAPLKFSDGSTLQILDEQNIHFCISSKIGGRHKSELPLQEQKVIGRTLARLHNISSTNNKTARPSLTPVTYGEENIDFICNSEYLPASSHHSYKSVAAPIIARAKIKYENLPLFRIHGDFHLGNVLWNNEQPTLLDFDDMVLGPAIQDLWLLNPGRDEASIERREALIDGYQELRTFSESELELVELLRALRIIHFQAWIGRRWKDPAFQRTFPEYGTPKYWRGELAALTEICEIVC